LKFSETPGKCNHTNLTAPIIGIDFLIRMAYVGLVKVLHFLGSNEYYMVKKKTTRKLVKRMLD
jgi:hypothetical protein